MSAQLDDYEQRRRFEEAIDAPEPPPGSGKSGASRAAALVAARDADGIRAIPFPGPTVLTRSYGDLHHRDPSWLYRLLSASAHGKSWSLMGMTLGPASEAGEGIQRGLLTGSDTVLVGSTRMAVDALAKRNRRPRAVSRHFVAVAPQEGAPEGGQELTATIRQYLNRHRACNTLVGDIATDLLSDPAVKGLSGYNSLLRVVNQHNLRDDRAVDALIEADKRFRASPEGLCEVEGSLTHCRFRDA